MLRIMSGICAAGIGMRLTQRAKDEDGEREGVCVQPYERPEEGREGGGQCVLVQGGIRRAMSLLEAIKKADKGSLILLRPGVYDAVLVLGKDDVTVGGDAACEDTVLRVRGDEGGGTPPCAVVCRAFGCTLVNLTIEYIGTDRSSSAVIVQSGSLTIKNCDIFNGVGCGVTVRRGMDCKLIGNRIRDSGSAGISLEQDVHSEIKYNDIVRSAGPAVLVQEGANPLIEENKIAKGRASGVLAIVNGKGIIRANEFLLNGKAGVEIRSGADPVVERNR